MKEKTEIDIVTELERLSEENKIMIEELGLLTKQLKEVNDRLEESERLKSHFISNITNEIVNPFASILGLSRNILSLKDKNWDKIQSMTNLIYFEAFNLDFQLKNIFTAAKIEAGNLTHQIVNVQISQLIKHLIECFKHETDQKKLEIIYEFEEENDEEVVFPTDHEKLQLILSNLLSNAIKFSNAGGNIEIKTEIDSNLISISIKDYGIGISEHNQKIIFDRFKRLDSSINSINRGHGLGLSIIKALLDIMEGKIKVESHAGKGSTFTIVLPKEQELCETHDFAVDGNETIFDVDAIF